MRADAYIPHVLECDWSPVKVRREAVEEGSAFVLFLREESGVVELGYVRRVSLIAGVLETSVQVQSIATYVARSEPLELNVNGRVDCIDCFAMSYRSTNDKWSKAYWARIGIHPRER